MTSENFIVAWVLCRMMFDIHTGGRQGLEITCGAISTRCRRGAEGERESNGTKF